MSILTLNRISYQYEGTKKRVLKDISINFDAGVLYAIMGKSGAGKSTMLSLVAGLEMPSDGELFFKGKNMKELDRDKYRAQNIGVIFQSYNLLLNATALENIILSMNISGNKEEDKKRYALSLLKKVGIDNETASRKVLKLSGGEQQRIGIARALAHNPDIIIADEPTGNLDPETETNIMEIFKKLVRDENKCVIVVTHSKPVASNATEIWGLNQGKLVFIKETKDA